MDATSEKSCLEEISCLIYDALQKVTLKTISNNWLVANDVAHQMLNKWMLQNEKKLKDLVKEFLIQGINSKGKFTIAVVNEDTKKRLEEKWKDMKAMLYSLETKSNSRDLNLPPKYEEIKVKNIMIDCGHRDLNVPVPVKQETVDTTKIKTPFGMVKPVAKTEVEKKPLRKEEPSTSVEKPVEAKKESPKKASPPTASKPSTSKNGKKNAQPVQSKNISSFFSKPSTSTKGVNNQKTQIMPEVKKESSPEVKEEKMEINSMEVDSNPRKRSASPPAKSKNDTKKKPQQKKLKPQNKKRSRIQVMDDSSEDEQEETSILDEPESKLIKFDREETPEPKGTRSRSPTPEEKPQTEKPSGKHKAKRWVTKRFETDDGFIRTEKVLEEYSASENEAENDENRKKNSPPAKTKTPAKTSPEKKSAAAKPKANGTTKTKQGSIMNFFTKK